MPDNITITAGAGTNIATDEIGGTHYQRVKPAFGADGSATDVSATAPLPTASGTPATVAGTINSAASLSGTITLPGELVGILMPAAWTTANLTFQGSIDGTNFFDLYDDLGVEVTAQVAGSRFIGISNSSPFRGLRSIRIRSGSSATPVNQASARNLTVAVLP